MVGAVPADVEEDTAPHLAVFGLFRDVVPGGLVRPGDRVVDQIVREGGECLLVLDVTEVVLGVRGRTEPVDRHLVVVGRREGTRGVAVVEQALALVRQFVLPRSLLRVVPDVGNGVRLCGPLQEQPRDERVVGELHPPFEHVGVALLVVAVVDDLVAPRRLSGGENRVARL